jgi:hypothetical protein
VRSAFLGRTECHDATMSTDILVSIQCPHPDCAGRQKQSTTFKRAGLGEILQEKDVPVSGPVCGHDWFSTQDEIANTCQYLKGTA